MKAKSEDPKVILRIHAQWIKWLLGVRRIKVNQQNFA